MDISFEISPFPSETGNLIFTAAEASNDSAPVQTIIIPPPHTASQTVNFTNLDKVPHKIRCIRQTGNTLLHSWMYYAKDQVYEIYDPIIFRIGDGGISTPAQGSTSYRNPFLVDKNYYVERRNIGTLQEGVDIQKDISGGFDLILTVPTADSFGAEEVFTIHILPSKISTPAVEGIAGKWFNGSMAFAVDTAYDVSHLRKLLKITEPITYSLPDGALMPIGFPLVFQTYGSASGDSTIEVNGGNFIKWGGANVTSLTLAQNQNLSIIWDGAYWQIVFISDELGLFGVTDDPLENDPGKLASSKATATLAGLIKIVGSGNIAVPDIVYDREVQVVHNLHITGPYMVICTFRSKSSNHLYDNKLTYCYYDATADSFKISIHEHSGDVQNIDVSWLAVKY